MNLNRLLSTFWLLILKVVFVASNDWSCGIGVITKKVSYAMVFMSDSKGVNQCCVEHDQLIDMYVHRQEADRIFCQCLSKSGSWYVRNVVKHLYCASVSLYTMVLSGEPRRVFPPHFNRSSLLAHHNLTEEDLLEAAKADSGEPMHFNSHVNAQPIRAYRAEFNHNKPYQLSSSSLELESNLRREVVFSAGDFHRT